MLLTALHPKTRPWALPFTRLLPWGPPRCQALTIPAHLRPETGSAPRGDWASDENLARGHRISDAKTSPIARFRVGVLSQP